MKFRGKNAIFDRSNWCWLLGHKWRTHYPHPEADAPIIDVTPVTYCTVPGCNGRRS